MLLIGPVQSKALAWGWVPSNELSSWDTRDVILDQAGDVTGYVQVRGDDYVQAIDRQSGESVKMAADDAEQIASFYTETEVTRGIVGALRLYTLIARVSLKDPNVENALESFIKDHRSGILDLSEVVKTLIIVRRADDSGMGEGEVETQEIQLLNFLDKQTDALTEILKRPAQSTVEYSLSDTHENLAHEQTFVMPIGNSELER